MIVPYAISLHQPWASLVCPPPWLDPVKMIETRGYRTHYRGPVLICSTASSKIPPMPVQNFRRLEALADPGLMCTCGHPATSHDVDVGCLDGCPCPKLWRAWPLGMALGVATIADCVATDEICWTWGAKRVDGRPEPPAHHGWLDPGPTWRKLLVMDDDDHESTFVNESERELGGYGPDRFGWLLDEISSFAKPFPILGWQRVWRTDHPRNPNLQERIAEAMAA